jgi:hypothetical protein
MSIDVRFFLLMSTYNSTCNAFYFYFFCVTLTFSPSFVVVIFLKELYAIFGKYGAVYQIRLGESHKDTRGTAFVVYEGV